MRQWGSSNAIGSAAISESHFPSAHQRFYSSLESKSGIYMHLLKYTPQNHIDRRQQSGTKVFRVNSRWVTWRMTSSSTTPKVGFLSRRNLSSHELRSGDKIYTLEGLRKCESSMDDRIAPLALSKLILLKRYAFLLISDGRSTLISMSQPALDNEQRTTTIKQETDYIEKSKVRGIFWHTLVDRHSEMSIKRAYICHLVTSQRHESDTSLPTRQSK